MIYRYDEDCKHNLDHSRRVINILNDVSRCGKLEKCSSSDLWGISNDFRHTLLPDIVIVQLFRGKLFLNGFDRLISLLINGFLAFPATVAWHCVGSREVIDMNVNMNEAVGCKELIS